MTEAAKHVTTSAVLAPIARQQSASVQAMELDPLDCQLYDVT